MLKSCAGKTELEPLEECALPQDFLHPLGANLTGELTASRPMSEPSMPWDAGVQWGLHVRSGQGSKGQGDLFKSIVSAQLN